MKKKFIGVVTCGRDNLNVVNMIFKGENFWWLYFLNDCQILVFSLEQRYCYWVRERLQSVSLKFPFTETTHMAWNIIKCCLWPIFYPTCDKIVCHMIIFLRPRKNSDCHMSFSFSVVVILFVQTAILKSALSKKVTINNWQLWISRRSTAR